MANNDSIARVDDGANSLRVVPIDRGMLPVAEVTSRVRRIQEVMTALMKKDVHYGIIPGTPKPTLYQPGAELLCTTFRIAPSPQVEDLSTSDAIRYRVTMRAVSQTSGEILGEGMGECSSDEEKYRWHRPVCDEEFAETPETLRREKWMRGRNGNFKAKQIRTSPADIANTVLKMAYKRALISMTRVSLACSDIFAQDLEDLPAEILETVVGAEHQPIQPPQRKAAPVPEPTPTPAGVREPGDEPTDDTTAALGPDGSVFVAEVKTAQGATKDTLNADGSVAKKGKPWKAYFVKLSDGREATTFNENLGTLLTKAHAERRPVDVVTVTSPKDAKKLDITEAALVG